MGYKNILRDFSGWTSAHGIPHIGSSHNCPLAFFWTTISLASFGSFCYFFVSLQIRFFSFGVKLQTELIYSIQEFPAITICNLNPYKITHLPLKSDIEELVHAYNYVTHNTSQKPVNLYGLDHVHDDDERRQLAKETMTIMVRRMKELGLEEIYHSNEDAIPEENRNPNSINSGSAGGAGGNKKRRKRQVASFTERINGTNETTLATTMNLTFKPEQETTLPGENLATSASTGPTTVSSIFATDSLIAKMSYNVEDLIISCVYNERECEQEDFTVIFDPELGQCIKFNDNKGLKDKFYVSTRAGPLYGLKMLVRSDQSLYLPFIDSAGIRMVVHEHGADEFVDAYGNNAAVGFTTTFGIKTTETNRKPWPYGNCVKDKTSHADYIYPGKYTAEGCVRTCLQHFVIENCGCADPRLPAHPTGNHPWCDLSAIECLKIAGNGSFHPVEKCTTCHYPCFELDYTMTLSEAKWPSQNYNPTECVQKGRSGTKERAECLKWYDENTALVEVYFERLYYTKLNAKEDYSSLSMISDTGGQLGFFLGTSFITLVEFISLGILTCIFCFNKAEGGPAFSDEDLDNEIEQEFDEDYCRKDEDEEANDVAENESEVSGSEDETKSSENDSLHSEA